MSRHEYRILLYGSLVAIGALLWLIFTPPETPDIAWHEANVARVTTEARAQRSRADSAAHASTRAEKRLANTAMLLTTAVLRAQATSDSSRIVVAGTSADVPTLRNALVAQLAVTDSLVASIFVYRASVDAYRDTVRVEREAHRLALAAWADSVPKATQGAIGAYKAEIRKLRVQRVALVGGVALLLYVATK